MLKSIIDGDLQPLTTHGGVTMYPASSLGRIFDWADRTGHQIEWIEGVFYDPVAKVGQLSVAYICQRPKDIDSRVFRATCLDTVAEMAEEVRSDSLMPYVEIGISY
jgi:hypothetical protein